MGIMEGYEEYDLEIVFKEAARRRNKSIKEIKFSFFRIVGKEIVSQYVSKDNTLKESPSFSLIKKN